jgi:hypothetical protein
MPALFGGFFARNAHGTYLGPWLPLRQMPIKRATPVDIRAACSDGRTSISSDPGRNPNSQSLVEAPVKAKEVDHGKD